MQHFKRVGSIQEDFERIGISSRLPKSEDGHRFPSEAPDALQEDDQQAVVMDVDLETPGEDHDSDETSSEDLQEARLVRKRLKRMKPGDRAKARLGRRKVKAKLNRKRRMKMKKAKFKIRQKRIKNLIKGKKAGVRRRFALVQDMGAPTSVVLESIREFELDMNSSVTEELMQAFGNVMALSSTLGRKFAVCEELMSMAEGKLGAEAGHEEDENGLETDENNIVDGEKTGDATDDATDAPAVESETEDEVKSEEENEDSDDDKDSEEVVAENCDDSLNAMGDELDSEDLDAESDDMESDDEESDVYYEADCTMDLAELRLEAQDIMHKLKADEITPDAASVILRDMVSYLGGMMKMYVDVAKDISTYTYAGISTPADEDESVAATDDDHNYVGKDEPESEAASPEQYSQRT